MTFLRFMDSVVIPAALVIFTIGGLCGILLGAALIARSRAALAFIARANRWVSTKDAIAPLDAPRHIEPPPRADGRRPVLGTFVAIGGAAAVFFLVVRLNFVHSTYSPAVSMLRYVLSGVALETAKWVLVAGSAFACVVGVMMLFAPRHYLALERQLNHWYSTADVLPPPSSETMRVVLEPHVEAHPRAAGWAIAIASLAVTLAMAGLLLARLHQ